MEDKRLFYNGVIITMDNNNSIVNCVYTVNGIIKDVGDFNKLRFKYHGYKAVNLKGNVLLPGFIEPHAHFDLSSMFSKMKSVSSIQFKDSATVLKELKDIIAKTPKGKWIMCFGLDYLISPDLPEMNRQYLDSLTTDHPLSILIQSMHTLYCNSLALKKGGITKDTKDTRDGHCYKDSSGEPNGVLTEQGFLVPFLKLWMEDANYPTDVILQEEAIRYRDLGITTVWTAGYFPVFKDHFETMVEFFDDENTPLRGDYALSYNCIEKGLVKDTHTSRVHTPKSHFTGIKFWYDGSPYTGNTFMYNNYLENDIMQKKLFIPKDQAGERLFDKKAFYDMLKTYHTQGFQISVHAQGNRGCHEVIEIFDKLLKEYPRKDHRHRLEHCAFIDKRDLKKAAEIGLTISFHVNHIFYYGEALRDLVVGPDVLETMLPCHSALMYGMKISLHSDAPMYSPNALRVAGGAITRKTRNGMVVNASEALSVTQALRAITIDAAWQLFREKEIGSIEVNKFADFTLIAENPYEVDKDHIKDIKVLTTFINGIDTKSMHYKGAKNHGKIRI